jgi:hypothetical protein
LPPAEERTHDEVFRAKATCDAAAIAENALGLAAMCALFVIGELVILVSRAAAVTAVRSGSGSFVFTGIRNTGPTEANGDTGSFPTIVELATRSRAPNKTNHAGDSFPEKDAA